MISLVQVAAEKQQLLWDPGVAVVFMCIALVGVAIVMC